MAAEALVAADLLQPWAQAVLMGQGVPQAHAAQAAAVLTRTSLRGIDTHGLARLPAYVEKLQSGEVNARAQPRIDLQHGLLCCNGDQGLGQVVLPFALEHAMAAARRTALVACRIQATGHLAALGTLALAAAEQGFIALLCQRTPPIMAMAGASAPAIGNNPLAFAMPVAGAAPLVFDMAHSVVARGQVLHAVREGRDSIPSHWALGPDGQPTTDPALALRGAMQPVAGHKGLGLAMLVECLAGSLNGMLLESPAADAPASGPSQGSASNVSAFLVVVNPALAIGQAAFDASVHAWTRHFLQASGPGARYPGQRQADCEQRRLRDGIPIAPGLLGELVAMGERSGCALNIQGLMVAELTEAKSYATQVL